MIISEKGISLIDKFEGHRLIAYPSLAGFLLGNYHIKHD